ncbi:inhibitory synaptic factor 1 [Monodelphis domestica]|uniref:Inhibitory synaptic factor 1 n=1 Tax=Monodelphis domestica TaxID=13616 RepID=F7BDA0_MONDO|nr:inhibitory synaptic factor 1 [Monodelphis domestica]
MNIRSAQDHGQASDNPSGGGGGERERIRRRMKMVIGQLEGILQELKEVAKELREVVSQIDKLTSDFDFEPEPDDWTTATVSSSSSSEKGGGIGAFDLAHLDFLTSDVLSDSWEFCSFLDISTPSDPGEGPEPAPQAPTPDYRLMNGGVLIPNGPRVETPDSSSEEAFSSCPPPAPPKGGQAHRTPGTRERVRFSDKVLYHALCCDDEEEEGEEETEEDGGVSSPTPPQTEPHVAPLKPPLASCKPRRSPLTSRNGSHAPTLTPGPGQARRVTRNTSTQTVSDKSTQTVLPYAATRQKVKGKN